MKKFNKLFFLIIVLASITILPLSSANFFDNFYNKITGNVIGQTCDSDRPWSCNSPNEICIEGKCLEFDGCFETDGNDIYKAGLTYTKIGERSASLKRDICFYDRIGDERMGSFLEEEYCNEDNLPKQRSVFCDFGCSEGRCLTEDECLADPLCKSNIFYCTDTDPSNDLYKKGEIIMKSPYSSDEKRVNSDSCSREVPNLIWETKCERTDNIYFIMGGTGKNILGNERAYCPDGEICSNGRCVIAQENCIDSDGSNKFVQSSINYGGKTYTDSCKDPTTVLEYVCIDNTPKIALAQCGEGYKCSLGKCVLETSTPASNNPPSSDSPSSSEPPKIDSPTSTNFLDCENNDYECLANYAKNCTPAEMNMTQELDFFGIISYSKNFVQIRKDSLENNCIYYQRMLEYSIDYDENLKNTLREQGMTNEEIALQLKELNEVEEYYGSEITCIKNTDEIYSMINNWKEGRFSSEDFSECTLTEFQQKSEQNNQNTCSSFDGVICGIGESCEGGVIIQTTDDLTAGETCCVEGICSNETSETNGPFECNGCLIEEKCFALGSTHEGKYCDPNSKNFLNRKTYRSFCSEDYQCSSGFCENGRCDERRIIQNTGCTSGCLKDGICYNIGSIVDGTFCSNDLSFKGQFSEGSSCHDNYECLDNLCIEEKCVSKSTWDRFTEWLRTAFGIF